MHLLGDHSQTTPKFQISLEHLPQTKEDAPNLILKYIPLHLNVLPKAKSHGLTVVPKQRQAKRLAGDFSVLGGKMSKRNAPSLRLR